MEKQKLIDLIELGLTGSKIAIELGVSESIIWRKLKEYNLKTKRAWTHSKDSKDAKEKKCVRCQLIKPISNFYYAGGKGSLYRRRYCSSCYYITKKNRKNEFRIWFEDYKKPLKCESCGNNDYRVLEFHHKNPQDKEADISTIVSSAIWSKERILDEVSKCSVLCANCHRIIHYKDKQLNK